VYPDALRRVSYFDAVTNKRLKFLTNNFVLPALTIAQIYKCRWQVELFFKWSRSVASEECHSNPIAAFASLATVAVRVRISTIGIR
jgi:IS4 transposase